MSVSVSKFILCASGLLAFASFPLAALSLSAGVLEFIENSLDILEKKEEYKQCHTFYKQLLNLLKAKSISEKVI